MATTAFAMKEALIREAKEIVALSDLAANEYIWDSSYSGVTRPRRVLWFGEIVWSEDRTVMVGSTPNPRQEIYNIRFGIEINDLDATQTDANRKARDILHEIELLVGDKRRFGIDGIVQMGVVPIGLGEGPGGAEGGRAAFLAAQVNVTARK
jgi:hypothetical protein